MTVTRVTTYNENTMQMLTVVETTTFQRDAANIWRSEEREEFINWIAANPQAGDVIPGAEGARKVRWKRAGSGKRGGTRVVYVNFLPEGFLLLIAIYAKSERENLTTKAIQQKR